MSFNTYLWRHSINKSSTVTNRSSEVAKIIKNREQNIKCCFGCVTRSAVLLKLNVANTLLCNFCEQKFVQHGPITFAIDCNGLSLLIIEEKWTNYASGQKCAPNSDSLCGGFSVPQMRQFCLFTYPPRAKWVSSEKIIFFFAKIGIFCKSIARLLSSVVQAYTQPYSLKN